MLLKDSNPEIYKELLIKNENISNGSNKVCTWLCGVCSQSWERSPKERVSGGKCPYCTGKVLLQGFNDLKTKYPLVSERFVGDDPGQVLPRTSTKYRWSCGNGLDHTFESTLFSVMKYGIVCSVCSHHTLLSGFNDIQTLHPEVSHLLVGNPSKVLASTGKKYTWKCAVGHNFDRTISSKIKYPECPVCTNQETLVGYNDLATTHPEVSKQLISHDPKTLRANSRKRVKWQCEHGTIWESDPRAKLKLANSCPCSSNRTVVRGFNDFNHTDKKLSEFLVNKNDGYECTRGSSKIVQWECKKGHKWSSSFNQIASGYMCIKCCEPKAETELKTYISSLGVRISGNDKSVITPLELDIYLPELHTAIEYNGLRWHSSLFKDKDYHKNKLELCRNAGISLIQVWEDDYLNKKSIVLSMLKHQLGLSDRVKVPGRKTKVSVLKKEEAYDFLENNHIQGKASGSYYLGLREKSSNNLVAVMVLTRTKNTLTLDRYATSCLVMGGQSKLLSYVDKNIPYDEIVTFADLSVSNGDLYERTGWTKDKELAPDYRYVVKGKREHKFNYRVKRFKTDPNLKYEEGLTERELAKLNNLYRIYDCGKIRYVRRNPNEVSTGD